MTKAATCWQGAHLPLVLVHLHGLGVDIFDLHEQWRWAGKSVLKCCAEDRGPQLSHMPGAAIARQPASPTHLNVIDAALCGRPAEHGAWGELGGPVWRWCRVCLGNAAGACCCRPLVCSDTLPACPPQPNAGGRQRGALCLHIIAQHHTNACTSASMHAAKTHAHARTRTQHALIPCVCETLLRWPARKPARTQCTRTWMGGRHGRSWRWLRSRVMQACF